MKKDAQHDSHGKTHSSSQRSVPAMLHASSPGQVSLRDAQGLLGNRGMQRLLSQTSDTTSRGNSDKSNEIGAKTDSPTEYQALPAGPDTGENPGVLLMDQQSPGADGGAAPASPVRPDAGAPISTPVPADFAPLTATIGTRVRSSTTPAAMTPDRIPPRVDFPVSVAVNNYRIPMVPVEVSVEGSSADNGTATLDGGATAQLYGSGTVNLRGTAQTAPGHAGNLRVVASWSGTVMARSNWFSIAAIPQDMVLASRTPLTGNRRGFVVTQTWSSDSGNLSDLNETQISEVVEYVSSTGIFSGLGANNSGYIAATGGTLTDTHGTPTSVLTGAGSRTANQVEIFLDNRTGVRDIPMRNSGFVIQRDVVSGTNPAGNPGYQITTSKSGMAVTVTQGTGAAARSFSVTAGSGSFSLPQWA